MITVTSSGLDLSPIVWRHESTWVSALQYIHHTVPGAVKGPTYITGKDNATSTIEGRCPRTSENEALLNRLMGSTVTVNGIGTHTGKVLNVVDTDQGGEKWIFFQMSVMEV